METTNAATATPKEMHENTKAAKDSAELVSYEWRSIFDENEGRAVSDWERAEKCSRCDRAIVHVYTVKRAGEGAEIVGKECAHSALGWARKNHAKLARLVTELEARKARLSGARMNAEAFSAPSGDEAVANCRARNRGFAGPVSVFTTPRGRFYSVPTDCEFQYAEAFAGWPMKRRGI